MDFCRVYHEIKAPTNRQFGAPEITGKIVFTPDLQKGEVWTVDGVVVPAMPIECEVIDGKMYDTRGEYPSRYVNLMAGGATSNPSAMHWRVSYHDMRVGKEHFYIEPFIFKTVPYTTINLSDVTPVAGYTPPGIIRGGTGDPGLGIIFKGVVLTREDLPVDGLEPNHAYAITTTKELAVWQGDSWTYIPNFAGIDVNLDDISEWHYEARKNVEFSREQLDTMRELKEMAEKYAEAGYDYMKMSMTSADGKSSIFYGSEPPETAKEGDTWFKDTEDGSVIITQYVDGNWVTQVDVDAMDKELADNAARVKDAQSAIDTLTTETLPALKAELDSLDTVTAPEVAEKLATLETKLANADVALKQGLQDELTALDEALSGDLTTKLAGLKDDLEAADAARAESVATAFVQLEDRLKAADKAVKDDLVAQLSDLETALEALDTAVGKNLTAKLSALRTELKNADTAVNEELVGKLATLKTQLQNADTTLASTLRGELSTLKTQLQNADEAVTTDLATRLDDARKVLKDASDAIATDLAEVDSAVSRQRPGNLFPDPFFKHPLWGSRYIADEECLELPANGNTNGVYYFPDGYNVFSNLMTLEPGASYLLTVDARFGGTDVLKQLVIYTRYRDASGDMKVIVAGRINRTDEVNYKWNATSAVLKVPDAVASEVTLGFYVTGGYSSGNVRLRNVRLHRAADNSLIIDGAVTAAKVKAGVIDADHIAAGAIVATKLAANSVVAGKIATNAVVADSIAANQVTTAKIAANAVTANEVAADAILARNIKAGQITTAKIAADAVTANAIAADAILARNIKANQITTAKIATNAVTANEIAADAILARNIKANQITTAKIATNAVTANEIAADTILASNIKANQITTAKIATDAVTANEIAANAVTANAIKAGEVTAGKIAAKAVTANEIASETILATNIKANQITTAKIATNAVRSNHIYTDQILAKHVKTDQILAKHVKAGEIKATHLLAEDATIDKLWANGIAAKSITATRLAVSPGNMFPDPDFQDPSWDVTSTGGINRISNGISLNADGTQNGVYLQPDGKANASMQHIPGVNYLLTANLRFGGNANITRFSVYARMKRDTGVTGASKVGEFVRFPTDGQDHASYRYMDNSAILDFSPIKMAPGGYFTLGFYVESSMTSGNVQIRNVRLTRMSGTTLIEDGAVTTGKVAANAITANQIDTDAVTAKQIKAGQITSDHISTAKISSDKITVKNSFIKNAMIGNGEISNAKIGTLDASKITAGYLNTNRIKSGTIKTAHIGANQITANKIASKAVKVDQIDANAVRSNHINTDQILAKHIKTDQILAKHVKAGEIKASHIAADTISAKEIKAEVFTQVGKSVIPLYPGTTRPAWSVNANQTGTSSNIKDGDQTWYRFGETKNAGSDNMVEVDPDIEYTFSTWIHGTTNAVTYIELRNQEGLHAVKTGGLTGYGKNDKRGSTYLLNNFKLVYGWRKISTKITFTPETRFIKISRIYGNHPNGITGSVYLADMRLYPNLAPQAKVDERQDQAIGKMEDYVKQMTGLFYSQSASYAKKFNELSEPQSGGLIAGQNEPGVMTTTTSKITCSPGWVGHILIHIMHKNYGGLLVKKREVTASDREFGLPSVASGNRRSVAIHWFKRPGRPYSTDISKGEVSMAEKVWTTVSTTTVGTGNWNLSATVGWRAATNHSYYGVRLLVNGTVVTQINPRKGLGPLLPFQDGYRTQTISASGDGNGRSTKFEIQAYVNAASASSERRIRDVNATLDWTKIN